MLGLIWLGDAVALAGFFVGGADVAQSGADHLLLQDGEEAGAIAASDDGLVMSLGEGYGVAVAFLHLGEGEAEGGVEEGGVLGDPLGEFDAGDFGTHVDVTEVDGLVTVVFEDFGGAFPDEAALSGAEED